MGAACCIEAYNLNFNWNFSSTKKSLPIAQTDISLVLQARMVKKWKVGEAAAIGSGRTKYWTNQKALWACQAFRLYFLSNNLEHRLDTRTSNMERSLNEDLQILKILSCEMFYYTRFCLANKNESAPGNRPSWHDLASDIHYKYCHNA